MLPEPPSGFTREASARDGRVGVTRYVARVPQRLDVKTLEKLLGADSTAVLQPAS